MKGVDKVKKIKIEYLSKIPSSFIFDEATWLNTNNLNQTLLN